MIQDEFDRILSKEDKIIPSSGFTASVMEAVRHEASAGAPIPFPWLRALPGIIVVSFMLVAVLVQIIIQLVKGFSAPKPLLNGPGWFTPNYLNSILRAPICVAIMWLAVVLFLSLASVVLSMHLKSTRPKRNLEIPCDEAMRDALFRDLSQLLHFIAHRPYQRKKCGNLRKRFNHFS